MSSANALDFKRTSRRDDLISLTYIMIFMITGRLDFIPNDSNIVTQMQQIKKIRDFKLTLTPEKLCACERSKPLFDFVSLIHSLQYEE